MSHIEPIHPRPESEPRFRGRPRRVLFLDLGRIEAAGESPLLAEPEPWLPAPENMAWIASWGGTALALTLLLELDLGQEPMLVLSVGEGVASGLPTAARAALSARVPLTGRLGEGQVGGALAFRLAERGDALVLRGKARRPGAVLILDKRGGVRLASRPELVGLDVHRTRHALGLAEGDAHLSIGPAGERGLHFASLASGGERPSFVGRGGFGALFHSLGLKSMVLEAREPDSVAPPAENEEHRELRQRLSASPRLASRAEGGSLELFALQAARGDALAHPTEAARELASGDSAARSVGRDAAGPRKVARDGCRGCPTPCGWVFEHSGGEMQRGRFNATEALGRSLGLEGLDPALRLLAACDRMGADAKEVGAILALLLMAQDRGLVEGPSERGDVLALERRIEELGRGAAWAESAVGGAAALARAWRLPGSTPLRRGQAARDVTNFAALLGQWVSRGGADPMRSFPFLVEDAGRDGLERLLTEVSPLPAGAQDPNSPEGKGRIVYWHENLVSGVDATGFCAFSTAGLLADDVCDLDRLAGWILPAALRNPEPSEWKALSPGERLLAMGANLVLLRYELDRRFAETSEVDRADSDAYPKGLRERLEQPGMLGEYRRFRGLDEQGRVEAERRRGIGTPRVLVGRVEGGAEAPGSLDPAEQPMPRAQVGRITLRFSGALREILGAELGLARPLPATLRDVVGALAEDEERAAAQLLSRGRAIPSVWRAGRKLEPTDRVDEGDVLDFVTAISGG